MISDKYQFIFVHFPRTGGSVFEQEYRKHYDPENDPRLEKSGQNEKHLDAQGYLDRYPGKFDKYYKFGFVRNPFDLAVSKYFHDDLYLRMTFPQYVLNHSADFLTGYNDFFVANDRYILDFALRYENYDDDLDTLCATLGVRLKYEKHSNDVLNEKYEKIHESRVAQIVRIVGTAAENCANSTGTQSPFDSSHAYDESGIKQFLTENFENLRGYFLNTFQEQKAEAFLEKDFSAIKIKRNTDYGSYFECEDKDDMIGHVRSYCPFILENFGYDF